MTHADTCAQTSRLLLNYFSHPLSYFLYLYITLMHRHLLLGVVIYEPLPTHFLLKTYLYTIPTLYGLYHQDNKENWEPGDEAGSSQYRLCGSCPSPSLSVSINMRIAAETVCVC